MNINRYNYEEFFLLYVDGELSAANRQTVEQFVQANPDLANELEMFQQTQLTPDTSAFDNKSVLYRNESAEINLNNYEELFLLYVDKELSGATKNKVETFVLQHPPLQEAFTLLKQTRLEPETFLFPNKQSLYRKEEKEKPVSYLHWTRIAVAAALTGLAVLVWTFMPNTKTPEQALAKLNTTNKLAPQKEPVEALSKKDNDAKFLEKMTTKPINTSDNTVHALHTIKKNNTPQVTATIKNIQNLITHNAAQPAPVESKKTEVAIVQSTPTVLVSSHNEQNLTKRNPPLVNTDIIAANKNAEESTALNNTAKPAVYKELDTEDDKKSLYLGSIEINKDKLRGFFRKAGSLFRGKARQQAEDEKSETSPVTNTRSLK